MGSWRAAAHRAGRAYRGSPGGHWAPASRRPARWTQATLRVRRPTHLLRAVERPAEVGQILAVFEMLTASSSSSRREEPRLRPGRPGHSRSVSTLMLSSTRSTSIRPRTELFIDGAFVPAASGRTFADITGRDGSTIAAGRRGRRRGRRPGGRRGPAVLRRRPLGRPVAGRSQAGPAPARRADARRTATSWPSSSRSTSASRSATRSGSTSTSSAKTIQWYAETIDKVYGEVGPTGPDALSLVTREPIGVVAAIVPWNYPLIITAWKLGRGARRRQLGRPEAGLAVAADGAPARRARRRRRACPTAC